MMSSYDFSANEYLSQSSLSPLFWIINLVYMLYLFQVLPTVRQTTVYVESSTMMQFTPPEI